MKKNRTLRVSALLLALTLITTCFVGGTFAKYTTRQGDSTTARVASWGFKASSITLSNTLFSDVYRDEEGNATVSSTEKVVAPGTTGYASFKFAPSFTPEVAYNFTVDVTGDCPDDLKAALVWSLDDTKCGENGTFEEMLAAIKALSGDNSGTKQYKPGELPDEFSLTKNQHIITWKWDFDDNGAVTNDPRDTQLGNASWESRSRVTLNIAITATQID